MAKQYLTVNGQLVMHNGKLIQVPDPDSINDLLDEQDGYATQLQQLSDDVSNLALNGLVDGTPRGSFQTLELLQTAYPDGAPGIYVITKTGEWCYYNEGWKIGGNYIEPDSGGGASITANIKITGNKDDILGTTEHNKLCILSDTGDLSFKVSNEYLGGIGLIRNLNGGTNGNYKWYSTYDNYGTYYYGSTFIYNRKNNYLYYFYYQMYSYTGRSSKTYKKYDLTNNTSSDVLSNLSFLNGQYSDTTSMGGVDIGDYIYLISSNGTYKINTIDDTYELLTSNKPSGYVGQSLLINNVWYVFQSNSYSTFDFNTNTWTTYSLTKSIGVGYCVYQYGNYVYSLGSLSSKTYTSINRINLNDNTVETLDLTLPFTSIFSGTGIGNSIYLIEYNKNIIKVLNLDNLTINDFVSVESNVPTYITFLRNDNSIQFGQLYNLQLNFTLSSNVLYIYTENMGKTFNLLENVTIPIKKVYIGDSNNTAQLANAYLYDETQTGWVNVNTGEVLS